MREDTITVDSTSRASIRADQELNGGRIEAKDIAHMLGNFMALADPTAAWNTPRRRLRWFVVVDVWRQTENSIAKA